MDFIEEIKKIVKEKLSGVDSCHEWEHTERVYNLALHIGKKEGADLKVLAISAILHDIARKEEDESNGKIDHAKRGAFLAREILEKYGLPEEKVKNIFHCIESHRYRNDIIPQTLEAKVLYDADKIDAMGAIGIGRAFSFAGHIGAKIHNKGVNFGKTETYSVEDTASREYEVKLRHLKDKMLTKEGKKMAKERHEFMEQFFDRLNKEVDGKL